MIGRITILLVASIICLLWLSLTAHSKIRAKPEIKQAWQELQSQHRRVQYDPFHEIWLFHVAEEIAYQPVEDNKDEDPE